MFFQKNDALKIITVQNPSMTELYPEDTYEKILQSLCFLIDPMRFMPDIETMLTFDKNLPDGRIVTKNGAVYDKKNICCMSPWNQYREASRRGRVSYVDRLVEIRSEIAKMYNESLLDKIKANGYPVVLPDVEYFVREHVRMTQGLKSGELTEMQYVRRMDSITPEFFKALEFSLEKNKESLTKINNMVPYKSK